MWKFHLWQKQGCCQHHPKRPNLLSVSMFFSKMNCNRFSEISKPGWPLNLWKIGYFHVYDFFWTINATIFHMNSINFCKNSKYLRHISSNRKIYVCKVWNFNQLELKSVSGGDDKIVSINLHRHPFRHL